MKSALLAILFALSSFIQAAAQDKKPDDNAIPKAYWLDLGIGLSTLGSGAFYFGANAELNHRILLTGTLISETNNLLDFTSNTSKDITTGGLLVGKVFKKGSGLLAVSAGLAAVTVNTSDSGFGGAHNEEQRSTVGIPIIVRGYGVLGQTLGGGLTGYINLNTITTTAGLTLSIALGRLATHPKVR